ncbi:MAG: hypothetical protein JST52_12100 [Bacteroidetes bacterium]|nr:hypothetical protein [Bacteroidota bacterium]MBS1740114.1 hypothetical protein [Bacteroidota bacterium]MBS1775107.1 hypothetical protein [Bacteroidota bacterium]
MVGKSLKNIGVLILLSFYSITITAQIQRRINELFKSSTFCEKSIFPIGIIAPSIKYLPHRTLTNNLTFENRVRVYFFGCIDSNGNINSLVFLGMKIYDVNNVCFEKELESDESEKLINLDQFTNYLHQVKFSPATDMKHFYSSKTVIIFESKKTKKNPTDDIVIRRFKLLN